MHVTVIGRVSGFKLSMENTGHGGGFLESAWQVHVEVPVHCTMVQIGRRFAAALLPRLFGTNPKYFSLLCSNADSD